MLWLEFRRHKSAFVAIHCGVTSRHAWRASPDEVEIGPLVELTLTRVRANVWQRHVCVVAIAEAAV